MRSTGTQLWREGGREGGRGDGEREGREGREGGRGREGEGGREREGEGEGKGEGGREGGREGEGVTKSQSCPQCGQNNVQICTNQGNDNIILSTEHAVVCLCVALCSVREWCHCRLCSVERSVDSPPAERGQSPAPSLHASTVSAV